jgi:hypothetical protein
MKPKITEISRSYSLKKSDGNYGSIDYFCSVTAEVEPKDDPEKVSDELILFCKREVDKQVYEKIVNKVPARQGVKNFWDTPRGEEMRERLNERSEEHGLDNGPRGAKYEEL